MSADLSLATVLDWTGHEPNPPPRLVRDGQARYRTAAHGVYVRPWASIDGICVHQTACHFGPAGDVQKRHERAFDVPIHCLAFNDGTVVLPYPAQWYLHHGNGWNARTLGIEIEGTFPGVEGVPGERLSDAGLAAARAGIGALVATARAHGAPMTYVWAHRQSTATRRADPGGEVWRRVVLEYAVAELGLKAQPGATLKDGRPIPSEWDPKHGVGTF